MATLANNVPTLLDVTKRLDPDGSVSAIGELLSQRNEILEDMPWYEGNLATGNRTTIRTGLPAVYWRLINQGIPPSKSTTAQVDEATGMLEAWAEVDKDLAQLNGNTAAWRMSENQGHIESMNQEMAQTLFYGNQQVSPEEFTGLAARYSSLSAASGKNIIDAGGTGSDNTSIYLIAWGANTLHGIYPKGTKAGLTHEDLGIQTVENVGGIGGAKMRAYQDHYQWKCGITLRDWRYVVRIANIDTSVLVTNSSPPDLTMLMSKAVHAIQDLKFGRPVFYMNRTAFAFLDIQRQASLESGGGITESNVDGVVRFAFRGIPIKISDALLETEARVV